MLPSHKPKRTRPGTGRQALPARGSHATPAAAQPRANVVNRKAKPPN